jgi:hypothetical protein
MGKLHPKNFVGYSLAAESGSWNFDLAASGQQGQISLFSIELESLSMSSAGYFRRPFTAVSGGCFKTNRRKFFRLFFSLKYKSST